jgi:SAM-dependent methyltransferase
MQAKKWFEDETYWTATYPFMFSQDRFTIAAESVPKILALSGCRDGRLLDLCCGPGRHSVPLAKIGFKVTGVDRSRFLLDKARQYALNEGAEIEWLESDMRTFVRPDTFNLALSMFSSFGYFEDMEENRRVLRNVHESLTTNGVFLMDLFGKETLARQYQPTHSEVLRNGDLLVQRIEISDSWTKTNSEWIITTEEKIQRFRLRLWCFSGQELKDLLSNAGFSQVSLYGDLEGTEYGPQAARLVAVARK